MKTLVMLKYQQFEDDGSEDQEVQNASGCIGVTMKRGKAWTSLKVKMKERL